jgi:hypothetical protein
MSVLDDGGIIGKKIDFNATDFYQETVTIPVGEQAYTTPGTFSWTAPAGVTSVSVVCVGGGGNGSTASFGGGGGGGLGWKNNISVTPGQSYTVVVGNSGETSYFSSTSIVAGYGGSTSTGTSGGTGGSYTGDGGGNGGVGGVAGDANSRAGAGGAGGYSGNGGNGGSYSGGWTVSTAGTGGAGGGGGNGYYSGRVGGGGGGVGILGEGASGSGGGFVSNSSGYRGQGGSGGEGGSQIATGGAYGGGGGNESGSGGQGAVRIIWGGNRSFPSTNTADGQGDSSVLINKNKKNSGLWNLDAIYKNFLPDIYTNSLVLWMDAVNEKSYGISENFVPYSADITPSAYPDWIPVNSVSSTATTGVDGQNDAFILSDNDATNYAAVYIVDDNNAAVYETVQTMTAICHVKKNTGGAWAIIDVYFQDTPSFTNGPVYRVWINPDNGDALSGANSTNVESVSEGDWWRIMFEVQTEGAGYDRMVWNIYPAASAAGSSLVGDDPTITGSNTFWNPQLQRGPKSNYSRPVKTGSTPIKREERWWDVSGQNNDGVVTGGAVYNSTYFEFDGLDDYIELGTITTSNPLQLSSPADGGLTIMFATYWDGTGDSYQRIIDKSNGGSGSNGWCIYPSSASPPAGNLIFQANPGTVYTLNSGQTLAVSTWEIWAITHDQTSGDWVWYRNGESIATGNATYNVPNVQTNARIGTWNHSTAREWNGRIGFMLVYEKALTQREITQNYNALKGSYGL